MKIYTVKTDKEEINKSIKLTSFFSNNKNFELVYFEEDKNSPNILISQGSGGHAYVFAELGYLLHLQGYNVFIMPKHGGYTINNLMQRHIDAVNHIKEHFNHRIGIFSEGLGGLVVFYLTLAQEPIKSAVYQNAPAILNEDKFHKAFIRGGKGSKRRKILLPILKRLVKIFPKVKIPISYYLNWWELIDSKEDNQQVEMKLVESYMNDPDFDKKYPLDAVISLVTTSPPQPIHNLKIPTMFILASRGFIPNYFKDLYNRLPQIKKRLVEVDGGVYWMLSNPEEATKIIDEWFNETL